jgi:predicted dehydrogenase
VTVRSARRPLSSLTAPLGIGIVGCGEVTRERHLPALRRLAKARVVALADPNPAARAAAAPGAPGARLVADAAELVVDPGVHAVLVATPPAHHEEVAVAALAAGRHVLCEKPMALTVASCERIAAAAADADRVLTVAFNLRHHPAVRAVRDAVGGGVLGPPGLVQSRSTSGGRPEAGEWTAYSDHGGGVLFEQAVHHADLWQFLLDDRLAEVRVQASGSDQATVAATTERGILISGAFSWRTGPENRVTVFGSRGRASADVYASEPATVHSSGVTGSEPRARVLSAARTVRSLPRAMAELRAGGAFDATYLAQWWRFLAATAGDEPNPCPPSAGVSATAAVHLMLREAGSPASEAAPVR